MSVQTSAMTSSSNPAAGAPIVVASHLCKKFQRDSFEVVALDDVSMEIAAGDFVALMGPSGSGKSTLLNMIAAIDHPSSGELRVMNENVFAFNDHQAAQWRNRHIGYIFQTFNLLPRATALHNVELPLIYAGIGTEERAQRALEALRRVDLEPRKNHRPNELSGGQRQRVAIARALVTRPSLILADEPTGNLDSTTSKEIMALFDRLWEEGNTIVLVTHEHDIAEYAHRVIYIRDGQVADDKPTARARPRA